MRVIVPEQKWSKVKLRKIHVDLAPFLSKKHKNEFYKSLKKGYKYAQSLLNEPKGKYILTVYSLLNAAYDNDRVVFSTSLNTINSILETDKNIKEKQRLTRDEYRVFLSFISSEKIFKILNPERKGKESLILELTDADFLPFFLQEKSNTYIEDQVKETLSFIEKAKKQEENLEESGEEDEIDENFDFLEGTNELRSLKSIKNNSEKNNSLEHRTQNIELTTPYLETRTQKIETTTSSPTTKNASENNVLNLEELYQKWESEYKEKKKEEVINSLNKEEEKEEEGGLINADFEAVNNTEHLVNYLKNKKIKYVYNKGNIKIDITVKNKKLDESKKELLLALLQTFGFQYNLYNSAGMVDRSEFNKFKEMVITFLDLANPNYDDDILDVVHSVINSDEKIKMAYEKIQKEKVEQEKQKKPVENNAVKKGVAAPPAQTPKIDTNSMTTSSDTIVLNGRNGFFDDVLTMWLDDTDTTTKEPNVEPKIETKAEPKIEPKTESKIEPKIETKSEVKLEPKPEAKVETKVNAGVSNTTTAVNQQPVNYQQYPNVLTQQKIPKNFEVKALNDYNNVTEKLKNIMKNEFNNIRHLEFFVEIWDDLKIDQFPPEHQSLLINRVDKLAEYVFESTEKCGLTITDKVKKLVDYVAILGPIFPCDYMINLIEAIFRQFTYSEKHSKVLAVYKQEIKSQFNKNMGTYRKKINEKDRL